MGNQTTRPLRFGVMCRGEKVADWQAACLDHLLRLPDVRLSLVIIDDDPAPPPVTPKQRLKRLRGPNAAWNLFERWALRDCADVDISRQLEGVPEIRCRTVLEGKFSQYFEADDLDIIRGHDLDFILRFAFNIIRGDVLTSAKYGVWSFHHGDLDRYRGSPAAAWEIYHRDPVTGSTLQRLNDRLDGGVVLKRGFFPTIAKSFQRSRSNVFMSSADFPAQVCRDIRAGQADYLDAPARKTSAPILKKPTNRETLRFVGRQAEALVSQNLQWLFLHDQWNIGWIDQPIHSLLEDSKPTINWLPALPKNRFIADPFGVEIDGETYILFEELDHANGKGRISAIRWEAGAKTETFPAFEDATHLSYPYVFEHDGQTYCVPEASESRSSRLYRITRFPDQWEELAVLLEDVPAIDTTIVQHEGRWWMFYATSVGEMGLSLHARYADRLEGPWLPHALDPLKTDITSARPGGTPFHHDGYLYRPAQDCGSTYGGRIIFNKVTMLTPTHFSEEPVAHLEPDPKGPFPAGLHTVSKVGERTLIDGKRKIFVPTLFRKELQKHLRRIQRR